MDWTSLALVTLTFIVAGFVKGVVGLGLPTIGMGLLAAVLSPAQAAALLVVPTFITNVQQAIGARSVSILVRTWPMQLGISAGILGIGIWGGRATLTADDGVRASIGLGIVLVLYGTLGLLSLRPSVPARSEIWLAPLMGVLTGVVTAATGVSMMPLAPYLQAIGLEKDDLVLALGISFTISTVALALLLIERRVLQGSIAGASVLALVPALIGTALGQWLRARVRAEVFRVSFFAVVLLLGAHLAMRAWI